MAVGLVWPPLLTAHRVERLWRMKPFVMFTGVFQRLPYLVAGLALLADQPFAQGDWVKIGDQVWMAENLRVTRYPNEDVINYVYNESDWFNL